MSHIIRIPLETVNRKPYAAEMLAVGRVVGASLELDYAVFAARFRTPRAVACPAGTELKALLGRLGINAEPGCSCNSRASEMDRRGCEWCEYNIDTIVGWLREEATKRGLPFIDAAGRLLVRRAIGNARKRHGQAHG